MQPGRGRPLTHTPPLQRSLPLQMMPSSHTVLSGALLPGQLPKPSQFESSWHWPSANPHCTLAEA